MHVLGITKAPLRELIFHLRHVERVTCAPESVHTEQPTDVYTLLVCGNGKGKLYMEDEVLLCARSSAFLVPPQAAYQIKSSDDRAIEWHKITFWITRMDSSGSPALFRDELFPHRCELRVYPSSQLVEMAEAIYRGEDRQEGMTYFQQNLDFMKLMNFVLRQHLPSNEKSSAVMAVERTIHYVQSHYFDKITVGRLERLAGGLPSGQYSAIFKELTGQKPLDYLTELRIRHSQRLLLETNESLRQIAERVGFTDEYYFNRRFRQMTGLSPRQYAASMKGRVRVRDWAGHDVTIPAKPSRIMFYGETVEDLLALGIQPVGGGLHGGSERFDLENAALLKPDLIILDKEDEEEYERISAIAPTLTYNSYDSLQERLTTLGRWLGKEEEAMQWLDRHAASLEEMWKKLGAFIREGETAAVFVHHRGKRLFVMGSIGLTTVLYHPDGFRPTGQVKAMLNAKMAYKEITLDDLQSYAGDRIFMLLPSSPVSRSALEETLQSPLWRDIPAVKNGFVHLVDELTWNCGDANTIGRLADKLSKLLA